MIGTILTIAWLNLKRDRVAQAMTFILPIAFFSIFAGIFVGQGRNSTPRVRVAVVDLDNSSLSVRLVQGLEREKALRIIRTAHPATRASRGAAEIPLDRAGAEELVRNGDVPVAIILPKGFGETLFDFSGKRAGIEILADVSDPIAPQVAGGLLQKVVMTSAPDAMAQMGIREFEKYAGALTPEQKEALHQWLPRIRSHLGSSGGDSAGDNPPGGGDQPSISPSADSAGSGAGGLVPVRTVDVLGRNRKSPMIAFYAAGLGVMFLLFSCTAAGGAMLEEVESGTMERLLSTSLGMGRLLAGKWLFLALLGFTQILVMFSWGMLVFKLELLEHLPGFLVMTAVTASAAAGFGLLLATTCRTRAQLSGISTISILIMSAVGGSMFPRFLMSESMRKLGLLTFNGWALDGYVKVFWRQAPVSALWPQVLVLALLATAFLGAARLLARRWESS